LNLQTQNDIMYAALVNVIRACPNIGANEEDAYAMCSIAQKAMDAVEATPVPKPLAELREISHSADRIANEWSDRVDAAAECELREAERRYNIARELSHLAFREYVEHPDYCKELTNNVGD
jgi:hypothetical protein